MKALKKAKKEADLGEIWLDQIEDLDLKSLLKAKPLPVVCVCKKHSDKGKFRGDFAEMAEILLEAVKFGADYVDIPMQMPEKLSKKIVQEARKKGCKVIISHHDFKAAPEYPKLVKMADLIKKRGANVVKIAVTAKSLQNVADLLAVGKYLQGSKTPHIAIAMGQKGILSRILTPAMGGEMMFAPLSDSKKTAPGQLTVGELKKAWSLIQPK